MVRNGSGTVHEVMKRNRSGRKTDNRHVPDGKNRQVSEQSRSGFGRLPQPVGRAGSLLSKRVLLACLVLIVASVIVYAPVRHFGFVWDDADYVTGNVHVAQGLNWQGVSWALTSGDASNWHPVTWLSHMLDVRLYGMDAGPQHVTNLLLHVLNALLLLGFLYRTTGALGRSTFVAALFALHPLHVESVAWISERKDVLSALFWMLTLWAYVAYVRRPQLSRYLLVLLLFVLGLMAKPMLVTLPFVLLLLDYWPLRRFEPGKPDQSGLAALRQRWPAVLRLAREKIPLFALAAMSSVVTILVQQHGGAISGLERVSLIIRLTNAMASYLAYMGKMLWPFRLSPFYPLVNSTPVFAASLGALALIGITIFATRRARSCGYLPVGWLWYIGTLVPVIGLVQVGGQSMADRYTYIPLIGLFLIAAWGAPELLDRWRYGRSFLPATAVCVLLACAVLSRAEVQYWSDGAALWQHALENSEDDYTAHNNLGGVLLKQGRADEALPHFVEALRIKPDLAVAEANMGMALISLGRLDQATQHFTAALQIEPNYPDAHDGLGNALAAQGRVREAAEQFSEALRLRPEYPDAHNDLGVALARQGKLDEAAHQFTEALRASPTFADAYHNLGNVLAGQGRLAEAVEQYAESIRLGPGSAETHNDLGVALAQQGKLAEAARHFAEALRIRPGFVDASENLERATAMRGTNAQ